MVRRWFSEAKPVHVPIEGQKQTHGGGYAFALSPEKQFERFLFLGSNSTYYATSWEMTAEAIAAAKYAFDNSPEFTMRLIERVYEEGSSPKLDPLLFAVGYALSHDNLGIRQWAKAFTSNQLRIPTHLFGVVFYATKFRGWGATLKKAVRGWYESKTPESLLFHGMKYWSRYGYTHQDLLRLSHPKPHNKEQQEVFEFLAKGRQKGTLFEESAIRTPLVYAWESLKMMENVGAAVEMIQGARLPHELIPGHFKKAVPENAPIWEALFAAGMPVWATLRNLNTFSAVGLSHPDFVQQVLERITDKKSIQDARVHPVHFLLASLYYARSNNKHMKWEVEKAYLDALRVGANYAWSNAVIDKRLMVALDISGSMASNGWMYSFHDPEPAPIDYEAMLVSLWQHVNRNDTFFYAFSESAQPIYVNPEATMNEIRDQLFDMNHICTNVGAPLEVALRENLHVDAFIIVTDNAVNRGQHAAELFREYQERLNPDAKFIVLAMTATDYSVADPNNPDMLDISGFDASVPVVIERFLEED